MKSGKQLIKKKKKIDNHNLTKSTKLLLLELMLSSAAKQTLLKFMQTLWINVTNT